MDACRLRALTTLGCLGMNPTEVRLAEAQLARGLGSSPVDLDVYMQRAFAAILDVNASTTRTGDVPVAAEATLEDILDFGNIGATDTTVTCRRCRSTDVRSEARQTRSADEAPTIFFDCRSCGAKWRCYC